MASVTLLLKEKWFASYCKCSKKSSKDVLMHAIAIQMDVFYNKQKITLQSLSASNPMFNMKINSIKSHKSAISNPKNKNDTRHSVVVGSSLHMK